MPTEVLVRVEAVGLNPLEARLRAGEFPLLGAPPFVLGWDVSGVVEESLSWRFRPGDEVFGMPLFPRAANAYAELVAAPPHCTWRSSRPRSRTSRPRRCPSSA
ncbi:alcohol dehydrogenase catalytic domain-containing protein [Nonomuraea salmonea]|uniref:alcohol dehydrogenase catalytic domain-containing protein n=1 Tax=Nonomuraea salmonea TaxID=46181 RepID=UPI002FEB4A34